MLDFPGWKKLITVVIIVIAFFIVVYDFYNKYETVGYSSGLKLGLDLKGGSSIVLDADANTLLNDYTKRTEDVIRSILSENSYRYSAFSRGIDTVSFVIKDKEDISKVVRRIKNFDKLLSVDQEGNKITVKVDNTALNNQITEAINSSMEIVRRRVDSIGTTEPSIRRLGNKQIVVELPGVDNPQQVKRILGTTALLTFHIVDKDATLYGKPLKPGYRFVKSADKTTNMYAIKIMPEIYGRDLTTARLQFQNNTPVVYFSLNNEGSRKFAILTSNQIGNMLAIVVDNKVISAPYINTAITGGNGIIQGSFTTEQAQELAVLLKAGSLPVPLKIVEERTIGPTLGVESIKAGLISAVIGYLLVFTFMVIFYRTLGLMANLSLIINVVIVLALLSLIGATLTLPGIAGIILTIGMAVDANILVYERVAYSIRNAKTNLSLNAVLSESFNRTFVTILDTNLTTLFTAIFLFGFGSGPIRGFAVTLIVGILSSIFCIMFVTRFLINTILLRKNRNKVIKVVS